MLIGVIILIIFIVLIMVIESNKERDSLSIESIDMVSEKIKSSFCVVFLADLHDKEFSEENKELIKAIEGIKPDIILIGGDTMNVRKSKIGLRFTDALLRNLSPIAPIYYGNGNNEQRMTWNKKDFSDYKTKFHGLLKKYNIHYLENSYEDIDNNIRIYGLDLELSHYRLLFYKYLTKEYIENSIGRVDTTKLNILLCHSPSFINAYADRGTDLVLSGQAHGGIIRFPTDRYKESGKIDNDRGLISSQLRLFHKYCAGVFWKGKTCMIVSRGLGTHTINIRVNNKPQIVVINLKPK